MAILCWVRHEACAKLEHHNDVVAQLMQDCKLRHTTAVRFCRGLSRCVHFCRSVRVHS